MVDASSEDATLDIARRLADVVAVRAFDNFANQRNAGLGLAAAEWVLSIDADERVTPELAAEIRERPCRPSNTSSAFGCRSEARFSGGRSSFSGTQQDLPLTAFPA